MDELLKLLVENIATGGSVAIITLLLLFVGLLIWDRRRLIKDLDKKEEKIDKIIDDYYKGNMTLTDALNGLKLVLVEIKAKL